jgi:hypothetical protein
MEGAKELFRGGSSLPLYGGDPPAERSGVVRRDRA